jgi:hypothetical protein
MRGFWIALLVGGCTYHRTIPSERLAPMREARQRDAVVLRVDDTWRARLSPNSRVRFRHGDAWSAWLDASALKLDDRGVWVDGARAGWRWDEIEDAEVETVSGGASLGAVVGVAALSVALAPLALLGDTFSWMGNMDGPPSGSPRPSQRAFDKLGAISIDDRDHTPGTWRPTLAATADAPPLFSFRARRRAIARLVVGADAVASRKHQSGGLTLAVRFTEMIELGASVRAQRDAGALWSFYLAGHFPLGAPHRWAIPLGIDAGGRDGAGYFRLRCGLRANVRGDWFVGVYPVNPVYAEHAWSYASGAELGAAF